MTRTAEERKDRFNNLIAVSIAILASFTAVCKVKDDNIVQAMQQAQASKVDDWAWYQAEHVRGDIMQAELHRLQAQSKSSSELSATRAELDKIQARKAETKAKAEQDAKDYDTLNYRDDQFDLSDASIAVAIALLAVSSLVQKRWLYCFGLLPGLWGMLMGLAGLAGWHIHPDGLIKLLS